MNTQARISRAPSALSGYDPDPHGWYQEGPAIVDRLLDAEAAFGGFPGTTWDPSCGEGNIPERFRARGLDAFGSDLIWRGYGEGPNDFLSCEPFECDHIVSNPPFHLLTPWTLRALEVAAGKVAIIARWAWYESKGRDVLFGRGAEYPTPLARVWVSAARVSMPPGGRGLKAKGGKACYAWFVFQRGHKGPPTLGRV